jgi:hypothetical protein
MAQKSRALFADRLTLHDYSSGVITAGTNKREWIVPAGSRITKILVWSGVAGTTAGPSIVDININGPSIYTTQASRPQQLTAGALLFTDAWPDGNTAVPEEVGGSGCGRVSYDVDAVTTTAPSRFQVMIVLGLP